MKFFVSHQFSQCKQCQKVTCAQVRFGGYIYRKEFAHDGQNLQGMLSSGFLANNNLSTLIKLVSNHLICSVFYFSKTSNQRILKKTSSLAQLFSAKDIEAFYAESVSHYSHFINRKMKAQRD